MAYSGEGSLIEAVVLGDPNKTVVPVVCDAEGRLLIDLNGTTVSIGKVEIEDSDGNSLTSVDGALNVNVTNPEPIAVVITAAQQITTNNLVSIDATSTPVLLLPENANRKALCIYNNSDVNMYIKFGTGVTENFYNLKLTKNATWESEFYSWSGEVWGLWDAASGTALVAELF